MRLLPAAYVKPYVKRGKTDAADAEAICEAVTRPSMRAVPIKTAEHQAALLLHRTRDLLVRQRTGLINAVRGHMAEFGIVAPQGAKRVGELVALIMGEDEAALPALARQGLRLLAAELAALEGRIEQAEAAIMSWRRESDASRRLAAIPGLGPITASAIVATVGDASQFRSARHFAAWLGLVPKQRSSGAKQRHRRRRSPGGKPSEAGPGGISKQGNPYLRRLLVVGATAVIRHAGGRLAASPLARGPRRCSNAARCGWSRWRWPTRRRALPGPCSSAARPTAAPRRHRPKRHAEGASAGQPGRRHKGSRG